MTSTEKLDLVVYGATGFTGKLVCEYLAQHYTGDGNIRWGIAGRNQGKLQAVKEALALADVPMFIAESEDTASLDAMAGACKVVLNTAGPYIKYGSSVVESCIRLGTDHVDLNGEPLWMHEVITQYEEAARKSGARIVLSCGFDSVPSDLGVQYLQEQALSRLGKTFPRVRFRVKAMKGSASGGTVASFAATMELAKKRPELFALMADAFALTPGFQGPEQPDGNKKIFEEDLGVWSGPFAMQMINTKVVHRSNMLLRHLYGENFLYDEMVLLGKDKDDSNKDNSFRFDTNLKPGEGPSKEEQQAGFYQIWIIGSTGDGEILKAIITGDRDPGYGSTSKMISEAAICLAQKPKGAEGGILTPAVAMGSELRERLHKYAGVSFSLQG